MREKAYQLTNPPPTLRRAKLDNLTLVTANLLPFKEQYTQLANDLPKGSVLIVLPSRQNLPRRILDTVSSFFRAEGHQVTAISADNFTET